jgi:integrase
MPRASSSGIKGVSIRHYPDDIKRAEAPWLARVKDDQGRPKGTWHATEKLAKQWAIDTLKSFAKGATAARVRMSVIGPAYVAQIKAAGVTEAHQLKVGHVWQAMVRNGLDSIDRPDFPTRFQSWVNQLEADWWISDEERAAPKSPHAFRLLKERNRGKLASPATKDFVVSTARSVIEAMAVMVPIPYIQHNPLRYIKPFTKAKDKKMRLCFTVEELKLMVSDKMRDHPFWLAACLAVYNPRRTSEAMFLRWEWIDWASMTVRLISTPETRAAKAGIKSGETAWPLEPELADILRPIAKPHGWILEDEQIRVYASWTRKWKEHTGKGEPAHTRGFGRYFEACGVVKGERVPYCLRHSGVTIRLAMNIPEGMVAIYAAHKDAVVTLKHYGRERVQFAPRVKHWGGRFYLRDAEPVPTEMAIAN